MLIFLGSPLSQSGVRIDSEPQRTDGMAGRQRRRGLQNSQRKTSVYLRGERSVVSPINTMQYTVDGEISALKSNARGRLECW